MMDDLTKAPTTVPTSRPCTQACRHGNHNNSRTVSPSPWLQSLHTPKIFQVPALVFVVLISSSNVSGQTKTILKPYIRAPTRPFREDVEVTLICDVQVDHSKTGALNSGQEALDWSRQGWLPAKYTVLPIKKTGEPGGIINYERRLTFKPTAKDHGKVVSCVATVGSHAARKTFEVQVDFPRTRATTTVTTTETTTSTIEQTTEEIEEPSDKEEPSEDNQWHPYLLIAIGGAIGLVVMIPVFWWYCRKRKPGATATPQPQQPLVMAPTSSFVLPSPHASFMIASQPQPTVFMAPQQSMMMQSPEQRGSLMVRGSQAMPSMMAEEAPLVTPDLGFFTAEQYPPSVDNSNQQQNSLVSGSIFSRIK